MKKTFDAIVVGGGHAGIEAAFALAHKQHQTLLITLDQNKLAMLPCNPAIGGSTKGILTKEIDALGGMQGFFSDKAMIQIKMLNHNKGPAIKSLRAQVDKNLYTKLVLKKVLATSKLTLLEAMVTKLIVKHKQIVGIQLADQMIVKAKVVIITTGVYLDAYILRGDVKYSSGPNGQKTTNKLSQSLQELGFELMRLKTGTPPRVATNSIDFTKVEKEQLPKSDYLFSFRSKQKLKQQVSCYLTYTNNKTHQIILDNLTKSSIYSGLASGVGPRYCPSIEDKVVRFKDKSRHQIFLEPETRKGDTIYVNGLSTSLPSDVQLKVLKTLPGFANAQVLKWGYAIEYDAIDTLQLQKSLEAKEISNLYFAGQINATSGYEEAAAQGIIAGINAALKLETKPPIVITRDVAYIGVLIDDLVTKGTNEPYRMLTSRAEYRLLLRNDNADQRLAKIGYQVGLITKKEWEKVKQKYQTILHEKERLSKIYVASKSWLAQKYQIKKSTSYLKLLLRPDVDPSDVTKFRYLYELTTQARLSGYIKKQKQVAKKMIRLEKIVLPNDLDYQTITNLATEARQKLTKIMPTTLGQAARISGINPSDIQMILFHLNLRFKNKKSNK